jgi:hypothetical protein
VVPFTVLSFATIDATPSFIAGQHSLVFDTTAPGFRPEWQLDASPGNLFFAVSNTVNNVSTFTEALAPTSVAPRKAPVRALDLRDRARAKKHRH